MSLEGDIMPERYLPISEVAERLGVHNVLDIKCRPVGYYLEVKRMTHSGITKQIIRQVGQHPLEFQQKVLEYAQALVPSLTKGTPGKQLLRFAGIIEPDDIQAMTKAIEVGCEKVDADEW